jgi:tRNA-dihydrouridine synthase
VLRSGNGGALLLNIPKMKNIILKIREKAPDLSISVKVRAGFSSHDEMNNFLPHLAKLPIDFIMFHFRTVREQYSEVQDKNKRLRQAVMLSGEIPLIASGDIFTEEDAAVSGQTSGCAGICIARGLLQNPFLPLILKEKREKIFHQHGKRIFYNRMLEIADRDPELRSKHYFIEIAKMMWGVNSNEFKSIRNNKQSYPFQ